MFFTSICLPLELLLNHSYSFESKYLPVLFLPWKEDWCLFFNFRDMNVSSCLCVKYFYFILLLYFIPLSCKLLRFTGSHLKVIYPSFLIIQKLKNVSQALCFAAQRMYMISVLQITRSASSVYLYRIIGLEKHLVVF